MVYDLDFEAPLAGAQVTIAETGETTEATDQGNYVFSEVKPGTYTLVFSKDGYTRKVKADVVVSPGRMTEVNASLSGEFLDMEEFVVQDVQIGTGTEAALLDLRMKSPELLDSISSELMSRAGASDAAGALKLVAGATIQDGKFAVIRGLPDRYVNSQLNDIRLPTADADKRAVQLDQFPSSVIESIQVSKTFTPDQQGDASGGAVNIILKGIPEQSILNLKTGISFNSQVYGENDFLTYDGGDLDFWGMQDRGTADGIKAGAPVNNNVAAGVSTGGAPTDYNWSVTAGGKHEFEEGFRIGALGSFFYETDSSFYDDGINDSRWFVPEKGIMEPQTSPDVSKKDDPTTQEFNTSLFDVTQGTEEVKWGGLGVLGLETEAHKLSLAYMYTHVAENEVTLAEDTRGKEFYFPGYDPTDNTDPGNAMDSRSTAPYLRTETLQYTERTTETLQFSGTHELPDMGFGFGEKFRFLAPEFDWYVATSSAEMYQPDKRQFGTIWLPESAWDPPLDQFLDPLPATHTQLQPGSYITFGNYQRIWKSICEESDQYSLNIKFPFEQWTGDEGYFKFGIFNDDVERNYKQESLSNSGLGVDGYEAAFNEFWSSVFPNTNPDDLPVQPGVDPDVNYRGEQHISAWYYMADMPLNPYFNIIGGARFEDTDLSIVNTPDDIDDVTLIGITPDGNPIEVAMSPDNKGDVSYKQQDVLPSIGFSFNPAKSLTIRGSYSETVARQTFKELSPIQQTEYLGGDVFIGNPDLKMSALKNYDIRVDFTPYEGGLFSASYFRKDITDPIEYVRMIAPTGGYAYTTAINYPEGQLDGFEFEIRQKLDMLSEKLKGFSVGANATLINSEVTLPSPGFGLPPEFQIAKRDMTNAPEHLYNIYLTYNQPRTGTNLGLFYTVRGDTLVAGAGQSNGNLIPNIYETEYGTLNFTMSQKLNDTWKLGFKAKNLLDPAIESVYRSPVGDVTKTSYHKGMEFSISLSATF
ncbi:TonB-dependent receptor [Anaerohalosphaera lusitana]|nr:TonB-dependent receptor [Anaerohalosphaera lusitana]